MNQRINQALKQLKEGQHLLAFLVTQELITQIKNNPRPLSPIETGDFHEAVNAINDITEMQPGAEQQFKTNAETHLKRLNAILNPNPEAEAFQEQQQAFKSWLNKEIFNTISDYLASIMTPEETAAVQADPTVMEKLYTLIIPQQDNALVRILRNNTTNQHHKITFVFESGPGKVTLKAIVTTHAGHP